MRRAVATTIDDNAADGKSDKSIWRLLNIRCTRIPKERTRELNAQRSFILYQRKERTASTELAHVLKKCIGQIDLPERNYHSLHRK